MLLKTSEPRNEKSGAWLGAALAFAAVLAYSTAAYAQNETKEKAGLSVWRSSGCSECHGAFANGEKERDEAPWHSEQPEDRQIDNPDFTLASSTFAAFWACPAVEHANTAATASAAQSDLHCIAGTLHFNRSATAAPARRCRADRPRGVRSFRTGFR